MSTQLDICIGKLMWEDPWRQTQENKWNLQQHWSTKHIFRFQSYHSCKSSLKCIHHTKLLQMQPIKKKPKESRTSSQNNNTTSHKVFVFFVITIRLNKQVLHEQQAAVHEFIRPNKMDLPIYRYNTIIQYQIAHF